MRKVEVILYNELWQTMFEEEANNLFEIFGSEIIEIHHIGSTSVNGLKAKPTIDIMPVVLKINQIDEYNAAMVLIGYESKGENGIKGRRYYKKGGDIRTHHVHIYEVGNSEIERHLAFRDYLRANPVVAKKYGDLKEKLSRCFPYDIASYINGKDQLALEIQQKAIDWYRLKGGHYA